MIILASAHPTISSVFQSCVCTKPTQIRVNSLMAIWKPNSLAL